MYIRARPYYDCCYHDCCHHDCCHSVVRGNANRHDSHNQRHVVCLEGVPRCVTTPEARRAILSKSRA